MLSSITVWVLCMTLTSGTGWQEVIQLRMAYTSAEQCESDVAWLNERGFNHLQMVPRH
jgi:hypothetical protein